MKTFAKYFIRKKDNAFVFEYHFRVENHRDENEWIDAKYEAQYIFNIAPKIGKIYMVGTQENIYMNNLKMNDFEIVLNISEDNKRGFAGNCNPTIYKYHGWRGTTNGWSFYAHGLREFIEVRIVGKESKKVRFVFGRDLAIERD